MNIDDLMNEYMPDPPWEVHIAWMLEHYGRRDPECFWCAENVWMSLQGFYSGGAWTTDPGEEGPGSAAHGPSTECAVSPDGAHDVLSLAVDSCDQELG